MRSKDDIPPTLNTYLWLTFKWILIVFIVFLLCFILFKLFHPVVGFGAIFLCILFWVREAMSLSRREKIAKLNHRSGLR